MSDMTRTFEIGDGHAPAEVTDPDNTGIIIVDHGSRRAESNDMLLEVVAQFRRATDWPIIEPAHMELAEPSIATAFGRCVERGATTIVVHPYFLLPGRHWHTDIPALTAEAAASHPGTRFLVTAPLGLHPQMSAVMQDRVVHCLAHVAGEAEECEVCRGTGRCELRAAETVNQ
jgi:sirohydrochlorin ferrochelatase